MACKITWISFLKMFVLFFLVTAITSACFTLPAENMLKDFLFWVDQDLGPWGPLPLFVAYIPLTILAVPASILTLGGGYLFGLPIGFVADSVGSTLGVGTAFLLGRTLGRSFVIFKLDEYPQLHAVAIAIQMSGFKAVIVLSLVISGLWLHLANTNCFLICLLVLLMFWVTRVSRDTLEKALADSDVGDGSLDSPESASLLAHPVETLHQPLTSS